MKSSQLYPFFLLFCLGTMIFAQKADSLSEKPNRYLVAKLDSFQFDRGNPLVWVYLTAYINNAKRKKDYETLFYGYRTAIYYSNQEEKLAYSDSVVVAAKMSKNTNLIGNAYLSRGGAYYIFRNYKKSLDNYLVANDILKNTSDKYLKNRVLYDISVIKIYLGYYDDALVLLRDATKYFESKKTSSHNLYYLRSIYRAGEIYQATNNLQKAKETNLQGLQESLKYKEKIQEQYFNLAVGVDDYLAGNYADAVRNIERSLPVLAANGYFEMEEKGNFYIAQSYIGLKQESKALAHFQQVDSLFVQNQYLPNEFRKTYEWLINYYKQENKDKQLYYVNQLLKVDEINAGNNKYLAYKINKEYDTQRLLEEKKQLERNFSSWQYYGLGVIFVLLTIGVWLFFRNRKIKLHNKQLKTQYDELLSQNELLKIKNQKETGTKKRLQEIPEDVMQDILNQLEQFEQKKEFLNPKIDQRYLAEKLKTNTAYLSKIINSNIGVSFNTYINNLRINYIIELLKKEPKYRKYTMEALAELCGYTNSRQFSDAFFSEAKLRPAYFLEQIQKEEPVPL